MRKFMEEQRRRFGDFEVIDFVDEEQVKRLQDQIDVDVPIIYRFRRARTVKGLHEGQGAQRRSAYRAVIRRHPFFSLSIRDL